MTAFTRFLPFWSVFGHTFLLHHHLLLLHHHHHLLLLHHFLLLLLRHRLLCRRCRRRRHLRKEWRHIPILLVDHHRHLRIHTSLIIPPYTYCLPRQNANIHVDSVVSCCVVLCVRVCVYVYIMFCYIFVWSTQQALFSMTSPVVATYWGSNPSLEKIKI